ncbi:MAG TPA: HlyD family secretion protein [Bryobacteraceae bacterium]|nr:HlyD family secretion protein [Bryobacteraceae bacterium]
MPGRTDADQEQRPAPDEIERLKDEVRRLRENQERLNAGAQIASENAREPEPPPPLRRSFIREHPVGAAAGLILFIAALAAAFLYWTYAQTFEDTDDAQIDGHLNAISTRIDGTVAAVHVVENQYVNQGDLLVELDPRDAEVALQRAQANLAQAQAQIRVEAPSVPITTATTQTSIATTTAGVVNAEAAVAQAQREHDARLAAVRQAEANNARAQADLVRYAALVKKDEVSQQDYDQHVAAAKSAAAEVESARAAAEAAQRGIEQRQAALQQARSQLNQAAVTAPEQMTAQKATVEWRRAGAATAQSALEEAKLNLSYTKIVAPVAGMVGRKAVEVGQRVQPGQQLLSIIPLDDIWVTANFKEAQLRHMRPGQKATIHVDAFDQDFDGYVESMPPATAARFSILPPENASGNYVKVVQRLPVRLRFRPGLSPDHRLRPGMSVVPKVWVK